MYGCPNSVRICSDYMRLSSTTVLLEGSFFFLESTIQEEKNWFANSKYVCRLVKYSIYLLIWKCLIQLAKT